MPSSSPALGSPKPQHDEHRPAARRDPVLTSLFGGGYGLYEVRKGSFVVSFLLNVLGVGILVAAGSWVAENRIQVQKQVSSLVTDISPYILAPAKSVGGGGGGGGDRDKLAATRGALPKAALQQITPPQVVVRNESPKLAAEPTVVVPPQIKLTQAGGIGDPLSKVFSSLSNGTGASGGIGSGAGSGVGSGTGPGVGPGIGGGIGGGVYRVGGGVAAPKVLYDPDPDYSEEARKAKYQGTVVLWVIVGPEGRTREVRVQHSLGMGLDEKAMEAVRRWKFEPAKKDGQPVAVQICIEVNFRLY